MIFLGDVYQKLYIALKISLITLEILLLNLYIDKVLKYFIDNLSFQSLVVLKFIDNATTLDLYLAFGPPYFLTFSPIYNYICLICNTLINYHKLRRRPLVFVGQLARNAE